MKKKLTAMLGTCICFVLSLFLVACMSSNKECVGSGDWVYDAQQHWQICKDEGCYKNSIMQTILIKITNVKFVGLLV